MESAESASQTITGITKANPAVVTYTGADPTNGDIVILAAQGMYQLDKRAVRIANVSGGGNTFEIEGCDSTGYDTFTSGAFTIATMGTSFSTIAEFSVSGGETEMIDTTTIHDSQKQSIPGALSATEISGSVNWDPTDSGQVAMKTASDAKAQKVFKVTFANGYKWIFRGYVGYSGSPTGQAQGKATSPFKIGCQGRPMFYST
jgi:hypothetical protein